MPAPGLFCTVCVFVRTRTCACARLYGVHGRVEQNLDVGSMGSAEAFLQPPATSISVSVWTLVSLPQAGRFVAKAVVFVYYLFTHPLCALSAFESLGCSQVAALRDLKRDPVGLGAESVFWGTLSRETLPPFPLENAAGTCSEDLHGTRVALFSRRGAAPTRGPHLVG